MANKTKKAQVILAAIDESSQSFNFLLLQTNEQRGSFWQNVTGKVEAGAPIEKGGLGEAIEETGLEIESIVDIKSLGLNYQFTDSRQRKVHEESFLIILDQKWNVKLDPHEHQSFKWVPLKDINSGSVKHQSNFETLAKSIALLRHWGG